MIDVTVFRTTGEPPAGYPYAQAIIKYGNINMLTRPRVQNADGTISTIKPIGIRFPDPDGTLRHVLIPTIADNGSVMSKDAATLLFRKNEKHLGIFSTKLDLSRYSRMLSDMERARIRGQEYEQKFVNSNQTAIYDAITSFRVNYGLTAGAEITVNFADYKGEMFKNNYFQIGQQYFYRKEAFQMAAVEVSQGEGLYWNVECKLRTWQQQQMKEDLQPQILKSANGYDFAQKLADKYGLKFIGEQVKNKQQTIKVKTKNNKESAWDVLQRSANDNQYYAFIADGTLFFCSPLFLLGQWGIDEVVGVKKTIIRYVPLVYPTPNNETRFLLVGLPTMRSSFDSPKVAEGSAKLLRDNTTQLRAGMTVYVKRMGIYNGAYIISSVDFNEGEPDPVEISFATVDKLAPEDQKKVDDKIEETTVISGSS